MSAPIIRTLAVFEVRGGDDKLVGVFLSDTLRAARTSAAARG
jgi:hypothetical protein